MDQTRSCSSCGRPVAAPAVFCPHCGGVLNPHAAGAAAPQSLASRGEPVSLGTSISVAGPGDRPASTAAHERRASILLLVPYLLFRPRTCLRHFMLSRRQPVIVLMCWTLGAAGVIERFEGKVITGSSRFDSFTWTQYWIVVAVGGLLGGLLAALIRGWWFKKRLAWSGATEPDYHDALGILLFSVQIVAVPAIIVTLAESLRYPSPVAAVHQADDWWYWLLAALPFWSVWISYRAATAAFVLRKAASIAWFLVVPSVYFLVIFGAFFVMGLFMTPAPADVHHPVRFDSRTMTFSYPQNWWINDDEADFDPDASVSVEPMQDALIRVFLYESDETPDVEIDISASNYGETMEGFARHGEFDSWGQFRGTGQSFRGRIDGAEYQVRLFVAETGSGKYLEVHEIWLGSDEDAVLPGLELIRSSFMLK